MPSSTHNSESLPEVLQVCAVDAAAEKLLQLNTEKLEEEPANLLWIVPFKYEMLQEKCWKISKDIF